MTEEEFQVSEEEVIKEVRRDDEKTELISSIPEVDFFIKRYANTTGDDQKALKIFKEFEPTERRRKLLSEVMLIKNKIVVEKVLDRVLTKRREAKYEGGYARWAELMLIWLNSKGSF